MRHIAVILLLSVCALAVAEQPEQLSELTVTARRPIRDAGLHRSAFDSLALRENVSLSMADVLAYHSGIFVKSYGRATLSTVAFRGTSPSHTQVSWNGLRVNSPMLGMTDFSTIPAMLVDHASLLHGSSSVSATGGGLGGSVQLSTSPVYERGWHASYIQGIGAFRTFDESARVSWSNGSWHVSTRAVLASSKNDFRYRNHDKKENIYDDNHNIIGQYHPIERNRSGAFRDIHVLQEVYRDTGRAGRFSLNAWYMGSRRELPLLTVDYGDADAFENLQREQTLRAIAAWSRQGRLWSLGANVGYVHSWLAYDYRRRNDSDIWTQMTRSRSRTDTYSVKFNADYAPSPQWLVTLTAEGWQHCVESHDKDVVSASGTKETTGYNKAQPELSASGTLRWQPSKRIGASGTLREELRVRPSGEKKAAVSSLIPAIGIDGVVWPEAALTLRASASRNYRYPTLNDLYFLPGGNPDLRPEKGYSYDAGASFAIGNGEAWRVDGNAGWFDSRIDDWILWLPTVKGFFSPRNVKTVHAYGVETNAAVKATPWQGWQLSIDASYSWTPSVNCGSPMTEADKSVGRQLPYVPRHSATATGRVAWRGWALLYKWCYYSRRYTMSSNETTLTGRLPSYYMNNVSVEHRLKIGRAGLNLKLAVNNLFNEDYLSVLSRPMPGINAEFFVGVEI